MTGNMVGRVFNNRYKITERIGIGGMAEVYRAQDNVLGRLVAVKTMLPQYAADPNFTQRFKQEAAAAANLQSPYIVNVYDWGQDEGTYYIVMEFVRGSDLKTAILERGAINQRKVAEIGAQVCQALSVAHNLDIIHRDIKPQNIMVQPDGNVKVMDFGIARAKNSVMTQTSSVLGTAHYISPEQAQGKDLTAASDMYSLGVVLYEAATGRLPFDGPDAVSVAMKQVNDLPVPPREINPDIDPALEAIIMRAMAKNPAERFATASDMRYALNDYLAGRPVNVGGFTAAETAILGGAAAQGVADGTAVMPGGIKPATATSQTKTYRGPDDGGEKKSKKPLFIALGVIAAIAIVAGLVFAFASGGSGDPVPDVTGKTVEEAAAILQQAGFELGKQDSAYDEKVEEGKIIKQDPAANQKREKGSKINVIVSLGVEQVEVPDLTKLSIQDAQKALSEKGLKAYAGKAEYSSDVPAEHIISQDPPAGTKVAKGSTVTYYASLGTEDIGVPNVVNYSQDEAISTLKASGFEAAVETAYSESVDYGYVISQNPSSGSKLEKGKTVTITVSKGPDPQKQKIDIPNVVGLTMSAAASALQGAGFDVYKTGDTDDSALVTAQNPTGQAMRGTTVTITGKLEPKPTPTPTPGPDQS